MTREPVAALRGILLFLGVAYLPRLIGVCGIAIALSACGAPVFSAQIRANNFSADTPLATRCFYFDNPYYDHHMKEMNEYVSQRAMRLAYVTHYTSNKTWAGPDLVDTVSGC